MNEWQFSICIQDLITPINKELTLKPAAESGSGDGFLYMVVASVSHACSYAYGLYHVRIKFILRQFSSCIEVLSLSLDAFSVSLSFSVSLCLSVSLSVSLSL